MDLGKTMLLPWCLGDLDGKVCAESRVSTEVQHGPVVGCYFVDILCDRSCDDSDRGLLWLTLRLAHVPLYRDDLAGGGCSRGSLLPAVAIESQCNTAFLGRR